MRSRATTTYGIAASSKLIGESSVLCPQVQPVVSLSMYSSKYTHIHLMHTYIYIYIYKQPATWINPGRKDSIHADTNSSNGLILLLSPAEQNKSPLMETAYEYIQYGTLQRTVRLVAATGSQHPQLLAPGHTSPLGPPPLCRCQYRPPHLQIHT